jgi:hypothetical protein
MNSWSSVERIAWRLAVACCRRDYLSLYRNVDATTSSMSGRMLIVLIVLSNRRGGQMPPYRTVALKVSALRFAPVHNRSGQ